MKKYYFVSWNAGDGVFCTNLAIAETVEDVKAVYGAGYVDVDVTECGSGEEVSYIKRGMPVTDCPHSEPEPDERTEEAPADGASYHISENEQYNSREVYFRGKPAKETREALKALKMRWNPKKMCWYGYAAEYEIIAAIQGAELTAKPEQGATVTTDGYMGGGAIYGSKSNTCLDGAELAKVFRAEIKKAGIKGVTIATRCGMTDHYSVTVTIERGDLTPAPEADPTNHYTCEMLRDAHRSGWLTIGGESYYCDKLESLPAEEQKELALRYHREEREQYAQGRSLNSYYMGGDNHPEFTPAFLAKLAKIKAILDAYRYDESNSMVDYFNTNFYYDFYTKPGKSWAVQADTSDIERAEEQAAAAVTA